MRYSLYINQPIALELGMENTTEAIIFDYLTVAPTWAKPEIIDQKIYYWVARQKICKEHEILNIKPKTVYRYLRKLHQKGLIDYIKLGKKDCISVTELGKRYISSTMGNLNSSPMGISKSQEEELKILSDGNLKSTYKYTNPIHLSENTLSKRAEFLKSFKSFVNFMRATYPNELILETTNKYTEKPIAISVSRKGLLYDLRTSDDFSGFEAQELWEQLYHMAKQGQLHCLTQYKGKN